MSEPNGQLQAEWFDRNDPSQVPSVEARKASCDWLNNPANPCHKYVGNQHAVRRLNRAAFAALGRYNHRCSDLSIAMIGPPSCGKATLARMFSKLIDLPFVEISSTCQSLTDVASQIADECQAFVLDDGRTLELVDLEGDIYMIPPSIVFIDSFQALGKKLEQGLAKAVSGKFTTENSFSFNTSHVCWIVSTSDAELLVEPFGKFTAIHLKPLTTKEIAQIVANHNPDFPGNVCQLIAQHADSPREALAYAKEMLLECEMNGGDWKEAVEVVAKDREDQKSSPWLNRLRNSRN